MSLNKNQAILVHEACQSSIKELNKNLLIVFDEIQDKQVLDDIRLSYAHAMANLIDAMERYVYVDYPELRPY